MKECSVLIAPSILSADFTRLANEIRSVEKAGADWIHVDVMDGHFVPNLTVGPVVLRWIRNVTSLFLDVHLMITDPGKYIPAFAESGADGITFHREVARDPKLLIRQIKNLKKKAGISIRPKTPVSSVLPYLQYLDLILVMTVEPGFSGQKFMPEMLEKIRVLDHQIHKSKLKCKIEVDGGIHPGTALLTVKEGADVLVAGNSIFGKKDRAAALKSIRDSIDKIREIR